MPDFYRLPKSTIHFPNLNGLRFIAALLVIIHHIEQIRSLFGLPNHWGNTSLLRLGDEGVTLFFVLSGFLITYLLLAEREKFGQLAIGKFYLRRVLRIWPLYYFIVLMGLLIMPHIPFFSIPELSAHALDDLPQKVLLFGLIVPNAALVLYGAVPYLSQAWSIGTEEQFYLFWPWVVQWGGKRVLAALIITAAFFITLKRVIAAWYHASGPEPGPVVSFCYNILYFFRIECMAIGAVLAAILFLRKDTILRWLMARSVQWGVLLLIVSLLLWGRHLPLHEEVYSSLFGILILGLAAAKRPILWMEYRWINFLGKISYGLYMLHLIAIVIVLRTLAPWFDGQGRAVSWLLTLATVMLLTVAFATLSYYGLEKPFLRLKEAFIRIRSQPDALLIVEDTAEKVRI
jgi:peptidoglycan/LPS O-acetylase OafA/YrhL